MRKNKQTMPTAAEMKIMFWETAKDLKSKSIEPSVANAIAAQGRGILQVIKTEIAVAKLASSSKAEVRKILK